MDETDASTLQVTIVTDGIHSRLTIMAKKRKLSDLTTQETNLFLDMIKSLKETLSEEDDDEKTVIASLDHVAAKLAQVQVGTLRYDFFGTQ